MQYVANSGLITLAATTEKTVLMVQAAEKIGFQVVEFGVFFNGTTGSNEPVLIELVKSTAATNSTPGTNNTTVTPVQVRGGGNKGKQSEAIAATVTAFANSTTEPTVLEALKTFLIPPTSGLLYQVPMGREPEAAPSTTFGIGLRIKAANEVKARVYMEFIQGPS